VVPEGKQRLRVAEGVYKKANGRFLATFRDPGHKQHWKEFPKQAEAANWRATGRLDPRLVLSGKRPLAEVWGKLLDHHGSQLKPTTRQNWEQEWKAHIAPALGNWPIGKVTTVVVKDYLAALEKKGIGAATRHKCRSILHRIFEEALENGEIASNPVAARGTRVKLPQRKKARVLTSEEVAHVVAAAAKVSGPSDALAIESMCFLGLRVGEMAGLQARDVDASRGEITVQRTVSDVGGHLTVQDSTKTGVYRVLPVPAELPVWGRLVSHIRERGLIGQAQLFQSTGGNTIRPNNWRRRVWAKAMENAAILDPPTPHSGRRTTASLLSAAGVPPATIQAILGHSTLQQTGEYIDVPKEEMEHGFRRLAALFAATPQSS